jgi:DNA topoisomerase-2
MAQNYVGSNNINLLEPIGQFGTRYMNGKDSASPRYIFTNLNPLTRYLFNEADDHVVEYLEEENMAIEPVYYVPILPLVLINGCEGIGTGWSTVVYPHKMEDVIKVIRKRMKNEPYRIMIGW